MDNKTLRWYFACVAVIIVICVGITSWKEVETKKAEVQLETLRQQNQSTPDSTYNGKTEIQPLRD